VRADTSYGAESITTGTFVSVLEDSVRAGLVTALVVSVVADALPFTAAAATPTTLFVSNIVNSHCDDTGPGSATEPFCTIQAAADVVLPGQTVVIGPTESNGSYHGFTLRRSGTPDQPIVSRLGGRGSNRHPPTISRTRSR
jgi:hypothetical protein